MKLSYYFMYSIFFHVCGIALLEILFYFYYIGPIESELLKNSMKHIAVNQYKEHNSFHYNITFITNTEIGKKLKQDNDISKKKRARKNSKLYKLALDYWVMFLGVSIFIAIIQFYYRYQKNKNKQIVRVDSSHSLELMPIRNRLSSIDSEDLNSNENEETNVMHITENVDIEQQNQNDIYSINNILPFDINNNKYIILEKKLTCKTITKRFFYYTLFMFILLAFEYCFFQYIVLNYEPLSDNELQYIIYTELLDQVSTE